MQDGTIKKQLLSSKTGEEKRDIPFFQKMPKKDERGGREGGMIVKIVLVRENLKKGNWAKLWAELHDQGPYTILFQNYITGCTGRKLVNCFEDVLEKYYRWHFKTGKIFCFV